MQHVYILHFNWPDGRLIHYVGWTEDEAKRLRQHKRGSGGKTTSAYIKAGGECTRVGLIPNGCKAVESYLAKWIKRNPTFWCPGCNGGKTPSCDEVVDPILRDAWHRKQKLKRLTKLK